MVLDIIKEINTFSRGGVCAFYVYQVDVLILGILELITVRTQLHASLLVLIGDIYPFTKLHYQFSLELHLY